MARDDAPLYGKTVLVTGATRGIGRATAEAFARAGANVMGTYLSAHDEARALEDELRRLEVRACLAQTHVGDADSLRELFARADDVFPEGLDVLVSNAATGVLRPAQELTPKHLRACFAVNTEAFVVLARECAARMRKKGQGGHVFALTSAGGTRVIPDYAAVGASKAALEAYARHLACELAQTGVTVNLICPGLVETDALEAFPHKDMIVRDARARTPTGHLTTAAEVADLIVLLTHPATKQMVGQTIVLDGGHSLLA